MKIIERTKRLLYNREMDIGTRLSVFFIGMGILASLLGTIICILAHVPIIGILSTVSIAIGAFIIINYSIRVNRLDTCKFIIAIGVIILLPIIWMTAGASTSGVTIWFVYGIFYLTLNSDKKTLKYYISIAMLLDLSCLVVDLTHPDVFFHFDNPRDQFISMGGSLFVVSATIIVTVVIMINLYNTEKALSDENEAKLSEANIQLSQANMAQKSFLANMSHEIRTPINAVLGLDELIIRETEDDTIRGYANDIQSSGKTLLSLVNDILDFSKIESGKMEILPVKYHFSSLVNDIYNMVQMKADDKGLDLQITNDATIPNELFGDEVRVRQILINILSNAIKYTKEGFVHLDFQYKKKGDDKIEFVICVSDSGIGIKPESIPVLFNSFQRVDEEKNRHIEGTGLGLAITKQLLVAMDGEVKVQSEYGKGTTFTIYLPQQVVTWDAVGSLEEGFKGKSASESTYHESFIAPEANVLVVDDVNMNIKVFKGLLKRTQVKIDTATGGEQAVEMAKKKKYDIIFMDHMMPGMNGIDAFNIMKADVSGPNAQTPVIALTANAILGAKENYLEMGFAGYLSKPIQSKALENCMIKFLPEEKVHREDMNVTQTEFASENVAPEVSKSLSTEYFNLELARSNCMDDDDFLADMVKTFAKENRMEEAEQTFQQVDSDVDAYRIIVHAVKSTSLTIGLEDLSAKAKELEFAAKDAKIDFIKEYHPAFMELYKEVVEHILDVYS